MGQLGQALQSGGGMTNTGLVDPNSGGIHWYGSANDALKNWAQGQRNFQPPLTSSDGTPLGQDQSKPAPAAVKPTLEQAASMGAVPGPGNVNAMSPGLTKAGKLMTLLTSGLQGALAGRAASEQATVASGGRRSGGAGMGFEAGYMLPWQRAQAEQQLEQGQAQTGLLRSEAQTVNVPGIGPMPGWLAKAVSPAALRAAATEQSAQTRAGATTQAAQTRAGASVDVARINQGMAIPVDETVANLAGFPKLAGQGVGKGTWSNINKALEAKGYHTQDMGKNGTDENSGMWLLDRDGNRIKQVSPNSLTFQRGASFAQNRPEQVVEDPNNPGVVTYTTAARAMNQRLQSPQSAGTQAAKAVTKSAVAGPIGNEINAFNTAIAHAQLLKTAFKAVNNGDVQLWNSIKNKAKTEFGWSEAPTAALIANAYGNEITKMLASGHMTEGEINKNGATVPTDIASPGRMEAALDAYESLARSKMQMRQQQVEKGQKGQANFPAQEIKEGDTATGPNGHKIKFSGGKWVDAATGQ